ncbi:MAG TPA: hypothetical protein DCG72_06520 [Gammaproteobacteria bacterium]|nr:hypothetical protein [Gammaproteobacteria bacterium]
MLFGLLRTPSAFENDPRGFSFNQAGHAGVGMLLAWLLGAWWPVAIGYAAWEVVQWRRFGGDDWDGLQDWAFVCLGAFAAFNLWLLVPMAGYLGAGYLRRADD